MINIKNLDSNKIKINKKSYKHILNYHIGYVTIKDLAYITVNSLNPLYLIINKINRYIEGNNENKYPTLVSTDEIQVTLKAYEELWNKIKCLIRSVANNSYNCDEKYIKMKFNSDDDLPLKKTLELYNMIIVVRFAFHEEKRYYPQVFLDECLHKL